jgi:hypothetical protein
MREKTSSLNLIKRLKESQGQEILLHRHSLARNFGEDETGTRFINEFVIPLAEEHGVAFDPNAKEENKYPFPRQKGSSEIQLNKVERIIGITIGQIRHASNIFIKELGDRYSDDYLRGEFFHICGAMTEIAGSKFLGVWPDFSFKNNFAKLGLDTGDGRYKEFSVDWKSASNDQIKISVWKRDNPIDIYGGIKRISGSWDDPERNIKFECLGFIKHEQAFEIGEVKDGSILIKAKQLKSLKQLLK